MGVKTCCFIGPLFPWADLDLLRSRIHRLITEERVTHFISTLAPGLDLTAAALVLEMRGHEPDAITLECVLPSQAQLDALSEEEQSQARLILARCDKKTLLWTSPTYVTDRSDYIFTLSGGEELSHPGSSRQRLVVVSPP